MSKDKKKGGKGVNAELQPSEELAAIVGSDPISRGQVMKSLWKYIKKNGLQDKQNINADDKLKPIFGNKKTVTMFEMQKHVSKHLTKA